MSTKWLEDEWASVLDGSASDAVYERIAEDDDARAELEAMRRLVGTVSAAGADHQPDPHALERLLARLPNGKSDAAPAEDGTEVPAAEAPAAEAPEADTSNVDGAEPNESAAPPATSDGPAPTLAPPTKQPRRLWPWLVGAGAVTVLGGVAVAAAAVLVALSAGRTIDSGVALISSGRSGGTVSRLETGGTARAERCVNGACAPLAVRGELPESGVVRTVGAARAELVLRDGTRLVLDRDTEIQLADGHLAALERGVLALESEGPLTVSTTRGALRGGPLKGVLEYDGQRARVVLTRGAATFGDGADGTTVGPGQEVVLDGSAKRLADGARLDQALAWSEPRESGEEAAPRGLGELRARKPGEREERAGQVRLVRHSVKARVVGSLARTEVEEVFHNDADEVLEGIYRFPLPADAQIELLSLDVDGKMENGAFVERERAAAIWRGAIVNATQKPVPQHEDIVWVPGPWRDPALLEWQRGGRFELRVYPIPKHGERRVRLAWTERLEPSAEGRRYVHPLPLAGAGGPKIERLELDVELRSAPGQAAPRARGWELASDGQAGVTRLRWSGDAVEPRGDLVIDLPSAARAPELVAHGYTDDAGGGFVSLDLRPSWPASTAAREPLDLAIVVDGSRSMLGEAHRRAARLATRLVAELGAQDQVFVWGGSGAGPRRFGDGALSGGPKSAERVATFLANTPALGASDPGALLTRVAAELPQSAQRRRRIVFISDATPTTGSLRPALLEREAREAVAARGGSENARLTVVTVGSGADSVSARALARGGGGAVVNHGPGSGVGEAAYRVLGSLYGDSLEDVRVTLPAGLTQLAPEKLEALPSGGELHLAARAVGGTTVSGEVVLEGRLRGAPVRRSYPLQLELSREAGNAFVPRQWAALRIGELESRSDEAAKRESIDLSRLYSVGSRYTSLLVLESPAMFRAFGLDNQRKVAEWTGETSSTSAESDAKEGKAELAAGSGTDDREEAEKRSGPEPMLYGGGNGGGGFLGGARSKAAPAPAPAGTAAPKPSKPATDGLEPGEPLIPELAPVQRPPLMPPPRRMIPMRVVWIRTGTVLPGASPTRLHGDALARATSAWSTTPDSRKVVRDLFTLRLLAGDLSGARAAADGWVQRDPLDVGALTAQADVAAESGDRTQALDLLASVLDVKPGDVDALKRLARLERWAGRSDVACRHSLALAQLRSTDVELVVDAVRCLRGTGSALATELLAGLPESLRSTVETRATSVVTTPELLRGDLRVEATWDGGADLDLVWLDPEGHRVSWLGAPNRARISALDPTSTSREGLALEGAAVGEYQLRVVRASGEGAAHGQLRITAGDQSRTVPFDLGAAANSTAVGLVRMGVRRELRPL